MAWIPGIVEFKKPAEQQNFFEGNIQITKAQTIVFHGVVTDDDSNKPVSKALVKVFARTSNNEDLPLSYSFSGDDGHYLMYIDKDTIPGDTTSIIIRASAGNISDS